MSISLHTRRLVLFILALVAVLTMPEMVSAQDRLPRIPADKLTEAQQEAIAEFKLHRGVDISGPFIPLLRSPELMVRAMAMGDYLRYKTVLGAPLNEFVILITARHWSQNYEWFVHAPIALQAGVSPEVVDAIKEGRRPTGMSADQTLVYEFCTEALRTQGAVTDALYKRAVNRFGENGTIEIVGVMGYYSLLGLVLNVARTPSPPPGLPPLPAPGR